MGTSIAEPKQESHAAITPIPLMQVATAFWAFKTLATAVDMDLFTRLSATPMTAPKRRGGSESKSAQPKCC